MSEKPERAVDLEGYGERALEGFRAADVVRGGGFSAVGSHLELTARVRALGKTVLLRVEGSGCEFDRRDVKLGPPLLDVIFVDRGGLTISMADSGTPSPGAC